MVVELIMQAQKLPNQKPQNGFNNHYHCQHRQYHQHCHQHCQQQLNGYYDPTKNYDILFKVLLIGDSGVGKTCVMCRFADCDFHPLHVSTIGIDFKMKTIKVQDKRVRVQIWDTAGQERYETITKQYYRKAQGVFLVYDITNERSFGNISKWMDLVAQNANTDVVLMLVANKRDKEEYRQISRDQGMKFAQEHGLHFCETSALNDECISDMFESMASELLRRHKLEEDQKAALQAMTGDDGSTAQIDTSTITPTCGGAERAELQTDRDSCCSIQ